MNRIVLSREAQDDLHEIKTHIAADSIQAARSVVAAFRQAFRRIAEMPGIGHTRKDLTPERVLFWPLYSYLIVYQPGSRQVEVLAILHGSRNLERVLRQRL
jgi:antitoxin ParD1/3/4/toxin ParE1/3/4